MPTNVSMPRNTTDMLYARARERGQRGQIWSALTGRTHCLLDLDKALKGSDVSPAAHSKPQVRMVPLGQIRGSESRCGDFDCDFNPLQDHNQGRWLSIAAARQRGRYLPPVVLVQVGDVYFVRDGHHRISVARALGQQVIEAKVLVWEVAGPLIKSTGQAKLLGRLCDEILSHIRPPRLEPSGEALGARL